MNYPDRIGLFRKQEERLDGASYRSDIEGLFVISSEEIHDGQTWQHVSMSRQSRMPNYDDLTKVKRLFIGDDRKAIMVFPEADKHVNIHPFCLHLYSCLTADPLPEFSRIVAGKRTI